MSAPMPARYPLLEAILSIKGLPLQATYTNRDVANIFGVSIRAIQNWVASENLGSRNLPGNVRFLPVDLEEFLQKSKKKGK